MAKAFGNVRTLPSGRLQVRYTAPDGSTKSGGTYGSLKAAEDRLAQLRADLTRHVWKDDSRGRMIFRNFAEEAMAHRATKLRAGTITNDRSNLKLRIIPALGHLPIRDINKVHMMALLDSLASTPNVRRNTYTTLCAILAYAVELGELPGRPWVRGAGRQTARQPKIYTVDDFQKLLCVAPRDWDVILWTMFSAHVRLGELRGLKRGDVNLETGTLLIERQARAQRLTDTKTGIIRTVPLLLPGLDALKNYLASHPKLPQAPLFSTWRGKHMSESHFYEVWHEMREQAGLPGITPHEK